VGVFFIYIYAIVSLVLWIIFLFIFYFPWNIFNDLLQIYFSWEMQLMAKLMLQIEFNIMAI
jgi:hypothetical protein